MTVYDLIEYLVDDSTTLEIYMLDEDKTVFSGDAYDLPDHFKELEIATIEVNENKLVINI